MTHTLKNYAIVLASIVLLSCAGGGIETTNGGLVAGRALKNDGTALGSARVVGRMVASPADSAVDTADASGYYQLHGLTAGTIAISILCTDGQLGGLVHVSKSRSDTTVQVGDLKTASLRDVIGVLHCGGLPCAGQVFIPELNRSASAGADGVFSVSGVPAGRLLLNAVATQDPTLIASRVVLDETPLTVDLVPYKVTLFDEFDQASRVHGASLVSYEGYWYFYADTSFASGSSQIVGACVQSPFTTCPDSVGAYQGKSFHADVQFSSTMQYHYALFGVNFMQGKTGVDSLRRWFDMTRVDSLALWVKGSGRVVLQFVTERRMLLGEGHQYQSSITLSPTWTRVVIKSSDITIGLTGEPPWSVAGTRTAGMTFNFSANTDFYMDDIELYGVWPVDLQGP